ncbi:MAG: hypothetical protein V2I32_04665 [Desulforhopalus sp.]|nr:hypothetical protein [Desulforhopalus sp.]
MCTDVLRISIMAMATCAVLIHPTVLGQACVIVVAAALGRFLFKSAQITLHDQLPLKVRQRTGALFLAIFFFYWLVCQFSPATVQPKQCPAPYSPLPSSSVRLCKIRSPA